MARIRGFESRKRIYDEKNAKFVESEKNLIKMIQESERRKKEFLEKEDKKVEKAKKRVNTLRASRDKVLAPMREYNLSLLVKMNPLFGANPITLGASRTFTAFEQLTTEVANGKEINVSLDELKDVLRPIFTQKVKDNDFVEKNDIQKKRKDSPDADNMPKASETNREEENRDKANEPISEQNHTNEANDKRIHLEQNQEDAVSYLTSALPEEKRQEFKEGDIQEIQTANLKEDETPNVEYEAAQDGLKQEFDLRSNRQSAETSSRFAENNFVPKPFRR